MKKKNRGLFITFEGGEGAGKTTLIQRISRALLEKGKSVLQTFEPGGTPLGQTIRKLLLDPTQPIPSKRCELFLFLADRAHHVQQVILPALRSGSIVLCDRFNDSTFAYQGEECALSPDFFKSLCSAATEGLIPDLTLYLDIHPKIGLKRVKEKGDFDRFEDKTDSFHKAVRDRFLLLVKQEPQRVRLLRAQDEADTVYAQALAAIESLYA